MGDILEIPTSNVSYLNFNSPERSTPKNLSVSEDGYLAILYNSSLLVGVIGCDPLNTDKKYIFNQDKFSIDFSFDNIINIGDFDFAKSVSENLIDDKIIFDLMLDQNFTIISSNCKSQEQYCSMEWSPLDIVSNKSYLTVYRFDGRIVIISQNKTNNCWEREFDVTDLYHKYYKDTLLQSTINDGIIHCKEAQEYINLKNDIKLIDFSWSGLVRHNETHQYCLLATLSRTGIVTIWRIINEQRESRCEHFYTQQTSLKDAEALNVKICDISDSSFLLTLVDSKDVVTSYPYSIVVGEQLTLIASGPLLIVNQQKRYCQLNKIAWSMKLSQLIIGFEWKLMIAKITVTDKGIFESETVMVYLPSNSEISGLTIKGHAAYITSSDGFLFAIKLSAKIASLELNQIIFKNPELNGNNEFIDVFVSPNGVHLGFLNIDVNTGHTPARYVSQIVMVSLMNEFQVLNILMDENNPFGRKQDAVEEMRHLYLNHKTSLEESLKKLGNSTVQWHNSSLHKLQFIRYICIFFGYKLNVNHEYSEPLRIEYDASKIRNLETIIIIKNISYWLDSFCEMDDDEIARDDCIFVLRVTGKLALVPDNQVSETINEACDKAIRVLTTKFYTEESEINAMRDITDDVTCLICGEICEFNLFAMKCPRNHILPRCCKSLEICLNKGKVCQVCGAMEKKSSDIKTMSNWRMEVVNSNCPLCDGRLQNSVL